MKPYFFHTAADAEFAEAILYYAVQSPGLDRRFYNEMLRLADEISAAPGRYRPWRHGARRHFGTTFPYALIYVERPDRLFIVAVAHFKRRPDYWRRRLRDTR